MSVPGLGQEAQEQYAQEVNEIMMVRLRIVAIIGSVFYLVSNWLDWVVYPQLAFFFLKIRLICVGFFLLVFSLTFYRKSKTWVVWLNDFLGAVAAIGILLMIYFADGFSSKYYEGLFLVFSGTAIVNTYSIKHNAFFYLFSVFFYYMVAIKNGHSYNTADFCCANFFLISLTIITVIMTELYSIQHRKSFDQQLLLDRLSKTDELTEIHNRRSFFEVLQSKIAEANGSNNPFYLAIFDVDYFKQLNDRWGHAFGDIVLTKIVAVVKDNLKQEDCLGRFGGDEFVVFLNISDSYKLMDRLTKISREITCLNIKQKNQNVLISISVGVAKYQPQQNMTRSQLLEKADQELLLIKKTNRGQIGIAE